MGGRGQDAFPRSLKAGINGTFQSEDGVGCRQYGLETQPASCSNPPCLAGKTVVFTGTLQMKRSEASAAAVQAGATVVPSVILIAGAGAGNPMEAAENEGLEVWDKAQFLQAISSTSNYLTPMAKKPKVEKCEDSNEAAEGSHSWQHYSEGRWNTFTAAASLWLSSAVSAGSSDVAKEIPFAKKPSNMRRIRRVLDADDRPCQTPEDTRAWNARLTFFLIKASKLKQLKEM